MKHWSGSKVVILGAARQGTALARFFASRNARVTLNDRRPFESLTQARESLEDLSGRIHWVCGGHPLDLLDGTDLLCLSGGVPLDLPLVVEAQRRGIPLSNDSQIFMEITPCQVIGITGSAGKTTTTTLVGRIARAALKSKQRDATGSRVWVGGNIGSPLITDIARMTPDDLVVMELSSFQLELMDRSPQIAAVLNITPNHLDRHATMQAYTAAKKRILDFQSENDWAILGHDDPGAWALAKNARANMLSFGFSALPAGVPGVFLRRDNLVLRSNEAPDTVIMRKDEIVLRGDHNVLNVMAACAIAHASGVQVNAMQTGVRGFSGVPHRLEFVRTWGGARWYNDSIATAPERAIAAIRSFEEPLILLAGGYDKNLPWDAFARQVNQRVNHLILFGAAAEVINQVILKVGVGKAVITRCSGLKDAVQVASQVVRPGDVVLLSPGGASFDEFNDFEERGECFVQWVKDLP